jgi:integrase
VKLQPQGKQSHLMRYRDERGDDRADVIDMLTMYPETRRRIVRALCRVGRRPSFAQANFRNREWTPALEHLGWGEYVRENGRRHFVPRYRIHDLRHTATSLAILAGAQPKVIQEMGGWSSIDIVMNRYGHLFDTLQDDLAARQEDAYRAGGGVG